MNFSPIILFVYNRPWHTEQTVEALKKNELASESDLFIFSDGPKVGNDENVRKVREYIKKVDGFKSVTVVENEKNLGLVESIIQGVSETIDKYGKVIVLEDDLITSKFFLKFMNEALNIYAKKENIYSVSGYMFPIKTEKTESFLMPFISTWGWGTWKEQWKYFKKDLNPSEIEEQFKSDSIKKRFNLSDYDYFWMLKNKLNTSWGIRWYYSVFIRGGLNVFPTKTLVTNIGFDGSGINCRRNSVNDLDIKNFDINVKNTMEIDLDMYGKYLDYFKNKGVKSRCLNFLSRFLKKY